MEECVPYMTIEYCMEEMPSNLVRTMWSDDFHMFRLFPQVDRIQTSSLNPDANEFRPMGAAASTESANGPFIIDSWQTLQTRPLHDSWWNQKLESVMNCIDVYWNEGHLFSVINTPFCVKSCRRCVTLCQASILTGRGGEENHSKYKEGSIKVDRMISIDDLEASKVMFTLTQTKWWKKRHVCCIERETVPCCIYGRREWRYQHEGQRQRDTGSWRPPTIFLHSVSVSFDRFSSPDVILCTVWMCFVLSMIVDVDRFISPFCIAEGFFLSHSMTVSGRKASPQLSCLLGVDHVSDIFFPFFSGSKQEKVVRTLMWMFVLNFFTPSEERNKILFFFKETGPREYSRHSFLHSLSLSLSFFHSSFLSWVGNISAKSCCTMLETNIDILFFSPLLRQCLSNKSTLDERSSPLTLCSLSPSVSFFYCRYPHVEGEKSTMSSTDASKATYVHAPERFLSAGTNHTSPNESTASTRTTEISINGNSYVNAPSPSSITSSSTLEHPLRYRPCSSRSKLT